MAELVGKTYQQFDAAASITGSEILLFLQGGKLRRVTPAALAAYVVAIGSELLATSATLVDLDAIEEGEGEGDDPEVSFVIQPNKGFVPGDVVVAAAKTAGTFIRGVVVSYTGTALTITAAIVAGEGEHNEWTIRAEVSTQLSAALALKADIDSPEFSGDVRAPTLNEGTNTTGVATTAFVKRAVDSVVSSLLGGAPPAALDTLEELAAALNDDANFAANVVSALGTINATLDSHAASIAAAQATIPSGTRMLFFQTAAPTGWTKVTSHDNKALRVVSGNGGGGGGSVAFSTVFGRTTTDATTLTTTQMPPHAHGLVFLQKDKSGAGNNVSDFKSSGNTDSTGNAGSGGPHSHNIDLRVQYVDVIIATKD